MFSLFLGAEKRADGREHNALGEDNGTFVPWNYKNCGLCQEDSRISGFKYYRSNNFTEGRLFRNYGM